MAELEYAYGLGPYPERVKGSSPFLPNSESFCPVPNLFWCGANLSSNTLKGCGVCYMEESEKMSPVRNLL